MGESQEIRKVKGLQEEIREGAGTQSGRSWVGTVASLRTDASPTDNSRFSAAATAAKYDCGNVALLLPDLFSFSREAGNLDLISYLNA